MKRGTWVWIAILAVCLVATVYELPRIATSVRQHAQMFIDPGDHPGFFVSDRLMTQDPEAGDILRYHLKWRREGNLHTELQALRAKYPDNAFLLAAWAEALAQRKNSRVRDSLDITDRLQANDPDNAYYHYLEGWMLLGMSKGHERLPEALQAFARGHELARFRTPYQEYKARVDLAAEKTALDGYDRPRVQPFYRSLGKIIGNASRWTGTAPESFRALIESATRLADRAMDNAYDEESLIGSAELMREIEQTRLKALDLSQADAWQARLRLSQAIATEDLRWSWDRDNVLTDATWMSMTPWFILFAIALGLLVQRAKSTRNTTETGFPPALGEGLMILITIGVFLFSYRMRTTGFWTKMLAEMPWFLIAFSWFDYASYLARAGRVGATATRRLHVDLAVGLLALNGVLMLLISNTAFLWSRSFAGWSEHIGVFVAWLLFCLLLWAAMLDRGAVLGRIPRAFALTAIVCWAGLLLAFDLVGTKWHYESRVCAEPLSVCGPLPAAIQETYERVIRDSVPPSYRRNDPNALPEHVNYMAPEDMERFLTQRQAEGRPLSGQQLQNLRDQSARDVRPVIQAMMDSRAIPETTPERIDKTETP